MTTRMFKDAISAKKVAQEIARGAGRIFDFSGAYSVSVRHKYVTEDSFAIDRESLRKDWEKVGNDLRTSMKRFEEEYVEKR